MTPPTAQDLANAALRASIADKFRREYEEALALAEAALGPGWLPTGKHVLVDKEDEDLARTGKHPMKPAAVVYTAQKDGQKRHFTLTDGIPREVASMEEGFGAMLGESHPTKRFTWGGKEIAPHKYSLYWSGFEPNYRPATAEQLAAARAKREQKAVEKEAWGSLFAEQIRAEGPVRRGRGPSVG